MSKMVEQVAKAICCPSGRCENDGKSYDPIKGSVSICQALSFDREALGAIAAMRKPDKAMISAAYDAPIMDGPKAVWQAMIDAALKE